MKPLDDLTEAVTCVKEWLAGDQPDLAIVLGSGLSSILSNLVDTRSISYSEIPGLTETGVAGHNGCLHFGSLFNRRVLIFQGRFHCYEGYSAWQVTAPVRLSAGLGCQKILLTNAAGGMADNMQPGDYMLVTDHLNLAGENPLRGRGDIEFLDLCGLYQKSFYQELKDSLSARGVSIFAGSLAWMLGPNYETPAEIRMLKILGASAVSMSTIPEAIVAKKNGMEVVAVSYISNLAAGMTTTQLDHHDVLESGQKSSSSFTNLISELFSAWLD